MKVHIVSPKDNWILQIIASKLMEINNGDIQLSQSQVINYEADLNYFINWCYWKILYPKLDKPEKTLVWFTHLDKDNEKYLDVLDRTDHIVAKSLHGKEVLLNRSIPYDKIHVLEGMGTLPDLPYRKIKLGISGRPYENGRKGEDIILKLAKDLDFNVWELVFENHSWYKIVEDIGLIGYVYQPIPNVDLEPGFWDIIDYWFSPSYAEGGPMDVLNAVKCGIPIISRDIGFFKELKTAEDIVFDSYEQLLSRLLRLQEIKQTKIDCMKRHTWDNFKDWHIKLFKEINES